MERCARMTIPVLCVLCVATVIGCTTTMLSPDKFRQTMAQYALKPGNKALFLNTQTFYSSSSWGYDTPQGAIDRARGDCVAQAAAPDNCVPVAVNDKQIYDPIPGALAAQQQQQQEQDQLNSALTSFIQNYHR
jgi:hypothetical protein